MNPEVIQQRIEQLECLILKQDATIKEQQQQNAALQNQMETHLQIMQQQKTEYGMKIQQAEAIFQQTISITATVTTQHNIWLGYQSNNKSIQPNKTIWSKKQPILFYKNRRKSDWIMWQ